ncbi:flavin-containing monooxygenase 5-like [Stegodyphus dumicola]|uniref:flavin-containing monooxygenase 5-like n=1 Tax=Stegodyphus dumicola TaxID=202533 RepID=UPI0015B31EBE|nr:flavin-containing monooxygenase 5-like [Stegodyphus dumicola]
MAAKKRIAVIGGGFAGILSIAMLKEEGMDPFCFEQTDKIGGTWNYREESTDGVASIMPTTIINHSKEMGALSNFPPRKEYNNYMRHDELFQYITEYCTENDCLKHIQLNMMVTCVKRCEDYDETGRWVVTARNTSTAEELTDTFDGVMVCVGHINRPIIPNFPGQEKFKGKIMHTHSLKEVSEFKDQNVLVVGMGASALDAAVGISDVAKQVYLSTRTGSYVLNRVGPRGYPIDYVLMRRYFLKCIDCIPIRLCNWYVEKFYIDPRFHHKLYNAPPKYHFLNKEPVLNDHFGPKLLSGSIIQKRDIVRFTDRGTVFEGSEEEILIDTVIMATGYTWKFPFLEEGIAQQEEDGKIILYKGMYPPHLKHPTLAITGFLLPFGPGFPVGEMQCRWAAHIFAGKGRLPSAKKMLKDITRTHERNVTRYAPNDKMTLRIDCMQYLDDLASKLGAKPNLFKLFFTDIRLFSKLCWGPFLSYQYRLQGPNKWDGARDAIMTCKERVKYPLRKDRIKQ